MIKGMSFRIIDSTENNIYSAQKFFIYLFKFIEYKNYKFGGKIKIWYQ